MIAPSLHICSRRINGTRPSTGTSCRAMKQKRASSFVRHFFAPLRQAATQTMPDEKWTLRPNFNEPTKPYCVVVTRPNAEIDVAQSKVFGPTQIIEYVSLEHNRAEIATYKPESGLSTEKTICGEIVLLRIYPVHCSTPATQLSVRAKDFCGLNYFSGTAPPMTRFHHHPRIHLQRNPHMEPADCRMLTSIVFGVRSVNPGELTLHVDDFQTNRCPQSSETAEPTCLGDVLRGIRGGWCIRPIHKESDQNANEGSASNGTSASRKNKSLIDMGRWMVNYAL